MISDDMDICDARAAAGRFSFLLLMLSSAAIARNRRALLEKMLPRPRLAAD